MPAKFTPGPWKLYSHSLAPWEQHRVENDHGNHVTELVECDQPDARLIAAAPELIAALDSLVMACELPGDHCEIEDALLVAKALLAKVDGVA